ncbi:ABC transporter permease [Nocardioides dongxiaopingii]|uniref:ABC transporter permease n=1 Tax=Nocardioides TaxID=1839 RepID=UPI0010C762B0|nr:MULTISPECIES: ABC transporter permease [Nocardioides]QCW49478.2 ABC transporter permease [Nocardioides sp. S-1144]
MRTVVLASLRTHTRRYVAAALAVVIGVAFVVTTAALSSATRDGLTRGVSAPYDGADVVVTGLSGRDAAALVAAAAEDGPDGAEASVLGWASLPVRRDDRTLDGVDEVAQVTTTPTLRWPELVDGAFPAGAGEAVVDAGAAERAGLAVGDALGIGQGDRARTVRVVGLVDSPSQLVRADVYVTWADLAPHADELYVDSLAWSGPTGALTDVVPDATVQDARDHVEEVTAEVNRGVDVVAILLLLFASIALFVSVLVISNTFSILFAQRQRDFALLRCVGATRRQVLRSVRLEALVLGLVAAAAGLVAGTAAGLGIVAVVNARFPDADLGRASVAPGWYAGAAVTGVVVTLVAAWLPTRRVTTVSPLAALRPDTGVDVRSASGRVRVALGAVALLGGAGLLAASVATTSPLVMVVGGAAAFGGVLLLGPLLVPALIGVAGRAASRVLGTPGRLATGNAVRHPRRTAATTASLLVGVTLTTAVLTGMASARGAVDDEMDASHPLDATLTAGGAGLPDGALDVVRAVDGVDDVLAVPGVRADVAGLGAVAVLGRPADVTAITRGPGTGLEVGDDEILLPHDLLPARGVPHRVEVTVGGRTEKLRAVLGEGWGSAALVSASTLAALTDTPRTTAVWVRADADADAGDLADGLDTAAAGLGASADGGLGERGYVDLQLDVVTGAVVGLLGIAVVIALVGIANTLGLSVLERGREHALLRALGLTRRQLRTMLGLEAVLLSVVATVLGTVIGTSFAWVGVQAMVRPVVPEAPLVLPLGQLALVVLVSAAAGLLACVLPARRAARVSPAAGLALD